MENKSIKVILEKVFVADADKAGNKFVDKNGKPYKKVAIKTDVHGDNWLSTLSFRDNDPVRDLQVGQSLDIVVEEVKSGDRTFLNFSIPSKVDKLSMKIDELEKRVIKLEGGEISQDDQPEIGGHVEDTFGNLEDEITQDDLPF